MNTPPDENTLLALHRPFIVGSTELATPEHYDGGIPVRALEGDLQIILDPWPQMSIGDEVNVYWGDLSTPVRSITIEYESQVGERVVVTVPRGFVIDGDAKMFYSVTRLGQPPENYQPVLTLLVKTQRPGGFDDSPEEGHSGLKYSFIPDVSNGVDPAMAERGVQIRIEPYENMAAFDRISCVWGSQRISYYPVTQQQVDDPVNHPILLTATKQVIENHGDGPNVVVTFQVIDRVGNFPDERAPWAKITRVLVDLKGNRLNAPLVLVRDIPVSTIDLKELLDTNALTRVYTLEGDYAKGDEIEMTWTGTTAQGQTIIVGPLKQTVEFVPFQCDFVIPNASIKAIVKGWGEAKFVLKRAGAADRPSKSNSVNVEGEISQLPAAKVDEAPGGTLNPEELWATVRIPWYPGRQRSDQMTLIWEARDAAGIPVYYDDPRPVGNVPDDQPVLRSVGNAVIRRFNGLRVSVIYRVANDDGMVLDVRESLPFFMQVGVAMPQFPAPRVEEAGQDGTLDPAHVPSTGATWVMLYTQTLAGDRVTWSWQGSAPGGSTSDFIDLTSHTAGKPVKSTIAKPYVTANLNGTAVTSFSIQRDGQLLGTSAELKLRIGTAQTELPPPEVVEAPDLILDPNQHQQGFTVRFNTAEVPAGSEIELTIIGRDGEGSTTPQRKPVNGQQRVDFNIAPAITGANLKRSVLIEYKVLNTRAPTPAQTLELRIGELLQQSMPKPLLEGFAGEVLQISLITNATKVLCDKWPFQRGGLPIWLSYKEQRTDGTSRSKDQFVGTAHDQGAGLSYTAEVAWLRECKRDSTVTIVLKVGLFREAMVSDAVECEAKVYTVKAGLDDLTTFDRFNWNGWVPYWGYPNEIVLEHGEYFVRATNKYNQLNLIKSFDDIEIGEVYELSFKYQFPYVSTLYLNRDDTEIVSILNFPGSNTWKTHTITFPSKNTSPASPMKLQLALGFKSGQPIGSSKIDDIRLRHIPKT
ncbi:hypothetical protein PS718_00590 [Pseudomonas fluorescens]|uniref:Uncharacterized protein n=1 Tax=Pseudomonas fluorescens TaxID=294 RepID=A0A5E7AAD9_PSEFL|nr:hypothetical protein [Pseudomonas fluorescens]VVN73714.1 hypothetical protein PS718_00590 [Pseudomonas fluorescens]